jgi:hypothetical protein
MIRGCFPCKHQHAGNIQMRIIGVPVTGILVPSPGIQGTFVTCFNGGFVGRIIVPVVPVYKSRSGIPEFTIETRGDAFLVNSV